jgi:hypothetical protein
LLEEAVDEVDAELLAVTDDIDAGRFLFAQPFERRALFALLQLSVFETPLGPEFFGFGEPVRLGKAAYSGGGKHLRILRRSTVVRGGVNLSVHSTRIILGRGFPYIRTSMSGTAPRTGTPCPS